MGDITVSAVSGIVLLGASVVVLLVAYHARGRADPALDQQMNERMWDRAIADQARLRVELDDVRRTVSALYRHLDEYMRGVRILVDQVLRLGEEPAWTPPAVDSLRPSAPGAADWPMSLIHVLESLYSLEEMELLAAGVGAGPGDVAGETTGARALGLVEWCRRRGKLDDLRARVRRERPNARLEDV